MAKPSGHKVKLGAQDLIKQRCFVHTVRTGGITSAARLLGLTPSGVSKNIARLEAELGVQLLARDKRHMVATGRGQEAFEAYSALLAQLDQVQEELAAPAALAGELGLSLPGGCLPWLAPLLARYRAAHPMVALRLNVSDGHSDLVRDRNDLALRFGRLKDSSVRALGLGATPLVVCASPAYLTRAGVPRQPAELAEHEGMLFRLPETGRPRPLELAPESGAWRAVAVIDDGQSLVHAALAGFGLIQAPLLLVQAELDAGRLVEVLAAHRPPPLEVNLLFSSHAWLPAQTRAFIDLAREHFGIGRAP
ncbi:LysR family transcriptional regulator [Massilia sp. ST3]|uniref:LysR family transcriptional regulator n=1 Tax=Massilia sp. ST3 TaxID=2824903 RepID=UPI001B832C4A|nr:LysR family transcriptional regulator [Massilia sp. ST3]MBQ5946087.1 LysR family transcriptional regulator [Massilia sp. ST3]